MKILFLECSMGAAGDMLMSALYELLPDKSDTSPDKAAFLAAMNSAGIPGVSLAASLVESHGIMGQRISVFVHGAEEDEHTHGAEEDEHTHTHTHGHAHTHAHEHSHTSLNDIRETISSLAVPESVKNRAMRVYESLARAEGEAHGREPGLAHFHEVGAMDAIADIIGVCLAAEILAPEKIICSPVNLGGGTVRCAHGILPVPSPAAAILLRGIPCCGSAPEDNFGELCTPTGAALLRELAEEFSAFPAMNISAIGVGAGKKQLSRPNILRAFLGEEGLHVNSDESKKIFSPINLESPDNYSSANGTIAELVCNIDDMTPESLAFASETLLSGGALDVYTLHGTMKKGRAGYVLTLLCEIRDIDKYARLIFKYTSTNGLRVRRCEKYFLTPETETVRLEPGAGEDFFDVRIKRAKGFDVTREKPEYDDIADIARKNNISYYECIKIIQNAITDTP